VVIKHMVKEAAEAEVQDNVLMGSRKALPRLGQRLGVCLIAVDLNGAFKLGQDGAGQLTVPNGRIKDPGRTARWKVCGGEDAASDEIGKRLGRVCHPVSLGLGNITIPFCEPHRLSHPLAAVLLLFAFIPTFGRVIRPLPTGVRAISFSALERTALTKKRTGCG
jgi:hypothetical protein